MKLSERVLNKLRSTSGESISEVLISMLIVALGSIMFATMVMASKNLIQKSDTAYSDYVNKRNWFVLEGTSPSDVGESDSSNYTDDIKAAVTGPATAEVTFIPKSGTNTYKEKVSIYRFGDEYIYEPSK
ncbi:MAG: hypothetical protein PHX95_10065 [Lachnospiraceae bacterium]|nr:hypothetical protein [Lachnospiraceae bacterium]